MRRPVITLLTDFGLADHYVAAMKGVILTICPTAELIDISHDVTPFAISEAAFTLSQTWQYYPKGAVHLAVVDPGVGSSRRAIVAEVDGHRFVAPDNGLLSMVLEGQTGTKLREITATRYFRATVSSTFQGRDIFAPVAAHLARGVPASKFGKTVADPVRGGFTKPTQLNQTRWLGTVLKIDRFGNIISNFEWEAFRNIAVAPFRLKVGRRVVARFYATYADAPDGRFFALRGSSGYIEVSLNQSDAAGKLGLISGSPIELSMPDFARPLA